MFFSDILNPNHSISKRTLYLIRTKCSQFVSESNGSPVFKRLDWSYGTSAKVKVRHSPTFKTSNIINDAFDQQIESTIVPVVTQPLDNLSHSDEWYYVFPTDGYRYLYSDQIVDYRYQVEKLSTKSGDRQLVVDMTRDSYTHNENLQEGIKSCVEVLLYGMSAFYVVSHSQNLNYSNLLSAVRQS